MSSIPPDNNLEQRITALLRDQPPRRAPASLEARVLAALNERRAVPWWQRSFAQWPLAARLAFLVASVGVGAVLALVGAPLLTQALQPAIRWTPMVARFAHTTADAAAIVVHSIPVIWLEGAAAFAAFLYLATFALGATAYRALHGRS
jgi:hypothetical protein